MRFGYTTGSCVTAAAKAAAIGLCIGNKPDKVEIDTPTCTKLRLNIFDKQLSDNTAGCAVQKDAGDDPDVTKWKLYGNSNRPSYIKARRGARYERKRNT